MRAALLGALLALGCKGGEPPARTAGKAVERAPGGEPAAATSLKELLGPAPRPVGPLAGLDIGMSLADARAAAPALMTGDDRYFSQPLAGMADLSAAVSVDEKTDRIRSLSLLLPVARRAEVEAAWGPGQQAMDDGGDKVMGPRTVWFDPAAGWRATLQTKFGDDLGLTFDRYQPAAALLGDGKAIGFAAERPILGATIEELRARYGARLVEETEAVAQADRAGLEKMMGQKLDARLGKATPRAYLELRPTEWGRFWTRVHLTWNDQGRVRAYDLGLPFGDHPAARDEIRALLEKKWGAPRPGTSLGRDVLVFQRSPSIEVHEDTIMKEWEVSVAAAKR